LGDSDALQADVDLPDNVLAAYTQLAEEAGLILEGKDQEQFDLKALIREALARSTVGPPSPALRDFLVDVVDRGHQFADHLIIINAGREALLAPLRQLLFWKKKDRVRSCGETGGNKLLRKLQQGSPNSFNSPRYHLMGHGFGCIVVSAMVTGSQGANGRPAKFSTLFLVQGALSLWSYADNNPYAPGPAGPLTAS
jgi:hypothetical protein